jgi:hypothetical protein
MYSPRYVLSLILSEDKKHTKQSCLHFFNFLDLYSKGQDLTLELFPSV